MSDYATMNALPSIPDTCGCSGCTNDTSFVMVKVSSGKGIQHRVASDVCNVVTTKAGKLITMGENYNFISWFTRCDDCLAKGIQNKKAKLKMEGEHKYYC